MLCRVALMVFLCAVYTMSVQADEPTKLWAGPYIGAAIGKTDGNVDFALSQPPLLIPRLRPPAQLFTRASEVVAQSWWESEVALSPACRRASQSGG